MAESEAADGALQASINEVPEEEWPPELEVCIEYCTRSPFHARYDPDKYVYYFNAVGDAFRTRSTLAKIVGNPCSGRKRVWKAFDKFGPLSEDVDVPRLGAFEVTVNSDKTGQVTIFSKLETRHWPNPRVLVCQVDRLLRGEPMIQPLPTRDSPRRRRLNESSCYWAQKTTSPTSTPREHASPERSEKASPRPSPKKAASGRKEAPPMRETAPVTADSKGIANETQPATEPTTLFEEDVPYDDGFEGDESGDGSSCLGTNKVWMPGAAKEEKWEEEPQKKEERKQKVDGTAQAVVSP